MGTRIRSPRAARLAIRFGSVWLLSLGLARGVGAGQPPALTDDSSRPSATSHAAADTSKKALSKSATTVKKTTTKPVTTAKAATAKPATTAPQTATAGKTAAVSKTAAPTAKSAVAPKTSVASKTPTVSNTAVSKTPVMATVAPAPGKNAPASSRGATTVAKPATVAKPSSTSPASANPSVATMAKSAAPVTRTTVAPAPARTVPLQKNASLTPGVSRVPSAARTPGGPKLAQTGGTVVRGPVRPDLTIGPPVPVGLGHPSGKAAPNAANASATGTLKVTTPAPAKGGVSKTGSVTAPAPLEEHVTYQYNALGRRDPFQSLIDGGWVGADMGGDAPPDVGGIKLVGIVWGTNDQFAMCEDVRGNSYVLRRGDRVMNGYVEGLKQDAMVVSITVDGQSESVTIPITRKGEKTNASR